MPIYDYVCSQCGHRTEVMHGIHAEGPTTCEVCGGALKKALSPPAIVFRGTGWAKKERSSAARSASAKKDGEGSSSADTSKDGSAAKSSTNGEGSTSSKSDPAPSTAPSSSTSSASSGS
jgi:putative FmdB family regulatory protein